MNQFNFSAEAIASLRRADFRAQYLGSWADLDRDDWAPVRRYHINTETFDINNCSGPATRDGVMPANGREMEASNRHADAVRRTMRTQYGMDMPEWQAMNMAYLRSGMSRDDIQELYRQYLELHPGFRARITGL